VASCNSNKLIGLALQLSARNCWYCKYVCTYSWSQKLCKVGGHPRTSFFFAPPGLYHFVQLLYWNKLKWPLPRLQPVFAPTPSTHNPPDQAKKINKFRRSPQLVPPKKVCICSSILTSTKVSCSDSHESNVHQSIRDAITPWKNNCHLISSDIDQLWLQLQSYFIPTLNLILVFLILILKKFSKKWASAQCLLQ
jgi:hypothetical protein